MRGHPSQSDELELDRDPTPEEELGGVFSNLDEKRKRLQNEKLKGEINLRKQYAKTSKTLAWTWAIFSMLMSLMQFCKPYGKHLEQTEFVAIVATALATIIALYVQVGKGMFAKSA